MEAFYGVLDGFLLGSRYEGMPRVVIEAIATNLPLILTRAPGNLDFAELGLSHVYWAEVGQRSRSCLSCSMLGIGLVRWH